MSSDLLSIKDFAAAAGVSQQSIYKRLNNSEDELCSFLREIDGKKYIIAAALYAIYKKEYQQTEAEPQAPEAPEEDNTSKIIEILREQLEAQRKDIEEKNKLIDRLSTQLEREQQLLCQEQQLNLANTQKILALEAAAAAEPQAPEAPEQSEIITELTEEPKAEREKKGFFSIFRRKGRS